MKISAHLCIALLSVVSSLSALANSYTYHIVATGSGTSELQWVGTPSLNNARQLAFSAQYSSSYYRVLVRATTNTLEFTGPDGSDDFFVLSQNPKISDSGTLVFQCVTNDLLFDPPNIWLSNISSTQRVVSGNIDLYPDFEDARYGIASGMDVLFSFLSITQAANRIVNRFQTGVVHQIATDGGPYDFDLILGTDIRTNGVVTFAGKLNGASSLFESSGGPITVRADTNDYPSGIGNFASGGWDDLAVVGILDDSFMNYIVVVDLFTGAAPIRVYAETNTFTQITLHLSLNDHRGLLIGREPLFAMTLTELMISEDGQPAQTVIKLGDPLDGAIVNGLSMSRHSMNNHGDFAFRAQLDDGRSVVVLATKREDVPSAFTRIESFPTGTLLSFTGEVSRAYVVQSSTNLVAWSDLSFTNALSPGTNSFMDAASPAHIKFYRLRHP